MFVVCLRDRDDPRAIKGDDARNDIALCLANEPVGEVVDEIEILAEALHNNLIRFNIEWLRNLLTTTGGISRFRADVGVHVSASRVFLLILMILLLFTHIITIFARLGPLI